MKTKEQYIKAALRRFGMRSTMHGFYYLVDIIGVVVDDPHKLTGIIKKVYVDVALKHDTTYACVERCVRHAIADSFTTAPIEVIHEVFGNSIQPHKDRPTAKHYIATVADYVRDEMARDAENEARVLAV